MVCVVLVKEFCHRDRGFGKQKLLQIDYSYAKRCGRYVILKVFDQFLQDGWTLLFLIRPEKELDLTFEEVAVSLDRRFRDKRQGRRTWRVLKDAYRLVLLVDAREAQSLNRSGLERQGPESLKRKIVLKRTEVKFQS